MRGTHDSKLESNAKEFFAEAGFSLIGVLVALAIVGISALAVSRGLIFSKWTQREVAVRQSAGKFQDAMRGEIAKTARLFVLDDCTGQRWGAGSKSGTPLSHAFSNFALSGTPTEGSARMYYTQSPVAMAPQHKAAANRCRSPIAKGKIDNGEYSYFCMRFQADTAYKKSKTMANPSFWNLDNSFMEVLLIPVDLSSDKPISCQAFQNSAINGIKVLYSIYYASPSQRPEKGSAAYLGKRLSGVFYVTGEQ